MKLSSVPEDGSHRRQTVHGYVRSEIADALTRGQLAPGDMLKVSHVARRFGVSRTPVYRAMHEMVQAGVLRDIGTGRFVVPDLNGVEPTRAIAKPAVWQDPGQGPANPRPRAKPLWDVLFKTVQREIAETTPFGSCFIIGATLASVHNVSRTVARDILARLQQAGIVRKDGDGRWVTVALTDRRLGDIYEIRQHLEPLALRRAFPFLSGPEIDAERAAVDACLAKFPAIDGAVLDAREDFLHVHCMEKGDNIELIALLRQTRLPLISNHAMFERILAIKPEIEFLQDHAAILTALSDRAIDVASAALSRHLERSADTYRQRMARLCQSAVPQLPEYLELVRSD